MSRIPRVPTALITTAALLAAVIAVVTITRGAEAADQDPPIIHTVSAPASQSPAYRSTVSSDGRYVIFEAAAGETPSLWFHDLQDPKEPEKTTVLPGLENLTAVMPSMSGDAGLVAFAGGRFGSNGQEPVREAQLYALNRRTPDNTKLTQVTGNANDLPYQRLLACPIDPGQTVCAPKLSRDGTTLAAPIRQSIASDELELTINGLPANSGNGLYPVMDFWAFDRSGEQTVTLKNTSVLPIVYPDTGPVIEGDPEFTIGSSTCAAVLQPDATCSVTIKYTGGADCSVESTGVLRFASTAASGQTAIAMTAGGECPRLAAFPPPAAGATAADAAAATPNCTGPAQQGQSQHRDPQPADSAHPHPWFPLGAVTAGEPGAAGFTISNSMSTPQIPNLTSKGCEMKLVLPEGTSEFACHPGEPIPAQSSCTAYVEYKYSEIAPFSASLHVGDTVYRIGGHAARRVIAAWHDPSASGAFGPGQVVSVTGANGVPMDGTQVTVSATGRWVGYTSTSPYGRPSNDPSPKGSAQIYLHDTDSAGDRTYKPGETTLVSLTTRGTPEYNATESSLSDDGTRIAFRGASLNDISDQVWVRDVVAKQSVLASADTNGQTANSESTDPQLSGDGHTVVYLSSASDLGPGALAGKRLIARDLTRDFAGGRGVNELISPRSSGPGSGTDDHFVSVNQNGTLATFASDDRVDQYTDADDESDVFFAQRRGAMTVAPDPVDFGTAKVGTTAGPVPYTVTNTGITALRFTKPRINGDEFAMASDQCVGVTIHPGQTCSFLLNFTPRAIGDRKGLVELFDDSGSVIIPPYTDLVGHGSSDVKMPGDTKHVSTNSAEHRDPAISDNGQYVAYRTRTSTGDSPYNQINVRNQANSDVTLFGQHSEVGPPAISADGTRVAYDSRDGRAEHMVVAGAAAKHEVTGTTTDLRYQRPCSYGFLLNECKPDLSGDGKTVAFGAKLDPRSDEQLSLNLQEFDGSTHQIRSLIDLGAGGTKTLTVGTERPIHFAAKPEVDAALGSGFWVTGTTCEGDLAANATCTIDVHFDSCAGAGNGILRINGATPEGQAAIALVANNNCVHIRSQPKVRAAACTPIAVPGTMPSASTGTTSAGNVVADADQVPVGATAYLAVTVPAQNRIQDIVLKSGCDFALLTPTTTDPNRPRPCVDGERLPADTACTAVVGYRPSAVDAGSAYLTTEGEGTAKPFRFTGTGYQQVVLTRTDTAGDGTFAGAPEIVTKDANGAVTFGYEPSLSANGRYVAFTGDYGTDAQSASLQVYRRDRTAGTTILASKLADGNVGTDDAQDPSLSASGDRVAFQTDGVSQPGEAARKAKAKAADEPAPHPSRIWVRDLTTDKAVLASAAAGKPTEDSDGWSSDPSLSDDGSTVGFSSLATDLVEQPGNDKQGVYVRYLEPDFAGAAASERFTERVSLNEEGAVVEEGISRLPSLSADGAFTAFESTSDLVAGTADEGQYDIFTRRRTAQLVATPAAADFGAVQIGQSSSAREMVVKNIGYGPAAAGPATAAAPFVAGSNVCAQTLHRGQSCTIDARFAPTAVGPATGTLTLPSKSGYLAGPSVAVGLTGSGTPLPPGARFAVAPLSLAFPAVEVGKASSPQPLKLQNTGDVALNVAATVKGADFGIKLGACTTVMPGATCDVPTTFAPRAAGNRTGSVAFTPTSADPAVKSPAAVTVGLSGSGTPGTAVASMTVAPQALVFGPQVLTVPSAPKSIVVTNTGTVPLTLSGVSSLPDFRPAVTCAPLQPGKTCVIAVRFAPQLVGARAGVVQVSATATGAVAPFPVPVKVSGTALTPTLLAEPPVARPGQIVLATGTNFPPNRPAVLGWDVGLGGQPAVADKTGKFAVPVLVYRRDVLGQRVLTATVPGLVDAAGKPLPVKSQPVLVMPLTYQPPNFVLRW
ncbi:choice-of-anchor D domain-containing protein [Kribbella sp. NPDC058245]|uniref:choice-of-anchor D domain-containing protein n=1 Tax=Kribbella sp. NPDC058245 TaxID=3346399 RepID=UPI0036F06701